jgi:alpha-tubulin suppressor-like RCC1 family protein
MATYTEDITESAAGADTALGVQTRSRVYVWGDNTNGVLGTANTTDLTTPFRLAYDFGPYPTVKLTTSTVTLLTRAGAIWVWGDNTGGALGQGNNTTKYAPTQIAGTWTQIQSGNGPGGSKTTYALKSDGTLWRWGNATVYTPTQVTGDWTGCTFVTPEGPRVPGSTMTNSPYWPSILFILKTDGTLWAMGNNDNGILGVGDTVAKTVPVQVGTATDWADAKLYVCGGASYQTMLALKADGSLWAWGYNGYGACATGGSAAQNSPSQITGTWASVHTTSTSVYANYGFVHAVQTDGTLWAWGGNYKYTCGVGTASGYTSPQQITGTDWLGVKFTYLLVSSTSTTVYAVKATGEMYSWGYGSFGTLGNGSTADASTPATPMGSTLVASVHVTPLVRAVYVLSRAGNLYVWGDQRIAADGGSSHTSPDMYAGTWLNVVRVAAAAADTAMMYQADGSLWVWGTNTYGEHGLGDTTTRSVPTAVSGTWVAGTTLQEINSMHTKLVPSVSGTSLVLKSWGQNGYSGSVGALGQGLAAYTDTSLSPVTVMASIHGYQLLTTSSTSVLLFSSEENLPTDVDWLEAALGADTTVPTAMTSKTFSDTSAAGSSYVLGGDFHTSDAAAGTDALVSDVVNWLYDSIAALETLASTSHTTSALATSAAVQDVLIAAFQQLITESATGTDGWLVTQGLDVIDLLVATETVSSTTVAVQALAETIATLEAYNSADKADIVEFSAMADTYVHRVQALVALIEAAQVVDTDTAQVRVIQLTTDTAAGVEALTNTGSFIKAVLADAVLATVRLNIGGELFTGWVLNTDTLAPSEYQFADRQFNSACKHGDRYLMAAEDGVYEFTEATNVESVMTYIKTGKTDFGSDLKKRIVNSYIVYSASGNMVLKVTTSEYGQLQTRNYKMVPPGNSETTDVRRFDLGRGIKSRYWQFELVGDGVDCDIDEIGMLPIVLSRRF